MPARDAAASTNADGGICDQCQTNKAVENTRARPLCQTCFCHYVSTKIVKRMEAFRTRHTPVGQQRVLLLPLSFGVSSTALLHCLDQQLERQMVKSGRTGFSLHILHVHLSGEREGEDHALFERVKARYPKHVYSERSLSDVMDLPDVEELLQQNGVDAAVPSTDSPSSNPDKLSTLLSALSSATARADVLQILQQKLIVAFAKTSSCEAIMWGDSTTRLAERTLAETAKGRGYSIPWVVNDGLSPHGVAFYYPVRDLLKKELFSYVGYVEPSLADLLVQEKPASAVVNAKNSTIDELMKSYFEGVERQYPSIVANVVRTTSKLQAPTVQADDANCGLCGLPIIASNGEDGFQTPGAASWHATPFCHGCARSFPQMSR